MPVAICFFLSGAAALILQVLWTRLLGQVFGATALAISTTLTVFMGGLALGSHLGGRIAPRLTRPLVAFGVLESTVGLYGLFVPSLLGWMPTLQTALELSSRAGFWGYSLFRFAAVTAILILPTTAMGATLPILAEGVVSAGGRLGADVGRLYAANTFGAVLGAVVAGFYLIPELGLSVTVYLAAAVDLLVAGIVLFMERLGGTRWFARPEQSQDPDERLAAFEPEEPKVVSSREQRWVLIAFAFSGAAAMALEVLWTRTVGVVIGASTYSFTLILTTFLVGLGAGAALMSRRVERLRDPVRTLAWVQLGIGITATLATLFGDRLPLWLHASARAKDLTHVGLYATSFAIAAAVTLPTTLLLGAVMPLVVRILAPAGRAHAGPIVGRAYALNTVGAIVGSFLAGFVILPQLGVERGLALAATISLAVGLGLGFAGGRPRGAIGWVALSGFALIALTPRWDVRTWTAGLFRMYLARSVYADGWTPSGRILFHEDGVATTVTVEGPEDAAARPKALVPEVSEGIGIALKVNGKVDASDIGDMPTQVLSGLLPLMMHPRPEDVLVIGYGSGVTPGAVLTAPVRSLKVAEIEANVYAASNAHFAHVNRRPFQDPRARLLVDDGRNFLRTRNDTYDVIISEPSNPWMSGAASLFTQDFFRIAAQRLNEGGIFLQWLQLYELAPKNIHALIRTFRSVFPHVAIFTPDPASNDTLLVGSATPLSLQRSRVSALLEGSRSRADLARAHVEVPEDLFGLFIVGGAELDRLVGEGPLNTDDNALIEFAAPKDLLIYADKNPSLPFLRDVEGRRLKLAPALLHGYSLEPESLTFIAHRLFLQGRYADAHDFAAAAARQGKDVNELTRLLHYGEGPDDKPVVIADAATKADPAYARAVLLMTEDHEAGALRLLDGERKFEERSLAHRFLYAFLAYRGERLDDAYYLMEKVLADEEFLAEHPTALFYGARILSERGKPREAAEFWERFDAAMLSVVSSEDPGLRSNTPAPGAP